MTDFEKKIKEYNDFIVTINQGMQYLLEIQKLIKYTLEEVRKLKCTCFPVDKDFFLEMPLEYLNFPVRIETALKYSGKVELIKHLEEKTENDLLRLPNFGRKSLNEVKETLARFNLGLSEKLG